MGNNKSKIPHKDYVVVEEKDNHFLVKKNEELFLVKKIPKTQEQAISYIEILKTINDPHVVDCRNSFTDEQNNMYVVMEFCQGGNLATAIQARTAEPQESEVLGWIADICIAVRTIHDKNLLHKNLFPKNILLKEFGTVCLGGFDAFQKTENCELYTKSSQKMNYCAPEVFQEGTYGDKSDIWSVGCILFEICTKQLAFAAETPVALIPKVICGPSPTLPEYFSSDLCEILQKMLQKNPNERPTANEILAHPIFINCLKEKCQKNVKELESKLGDLRELADGLEKVHEGTTIGSLAGGVIGAVGGITSIVGLILAPFTLGASLIVTGIGVGVGAAGGITAGASNITNMTKKSSSRKAFEDMIKEFQQKIKMVLTWLQVIGDCLQFLSNILPQENCSGCDITATTLTTVGLRSVRGLGAIPELVRLLEVSAVGKIVAQTARVVRIAQVATGIISGLFVAIDSFFIFIDAKEIHNIKQARAAQSSQTESEPEIKSEIMKFVKSTRKAADDLREILNEIQDMISSIPSLQGGNYFDPTSKYAGQLEPVQ